MQLESNRLVSVLQTREELERMIEAMSEYERAQVSPDWLARMRASRTPDPWTHGFKVVRRDTGEVVGSCGFKGSPVDGIVEIAYGVGIESQGNGYATEAAQALVDFASACAEVRLIRAHTLPDAAASRRVLTKCGFAYVGEAVDPDDGTVSRFERLVGVTAGAA
jgi:RimJ/RimL family protein N-acetyltransferase